MSFEIGGGFWGVPSDAAEPSRDTIFTILSNERRRRVIAYLQGINRPAELAELVDVIAAHEVGTPIEEVSPPQRKRVYTALRQAHLPKMDEAGIVEFDPETGQVDLTLGTQAAYRYLQYAPRHDLPWSYLYLSLGVIGAILVGLHSFDVSVLSRVPFDLVVFSVLGSFLVAAAAHSAWSRRYRASRRPPRETTE